MAFSALASVSRSKVDFSTPRAAARVCFFRLFFFQGLRPEHASSKHVDRVRLRGGRSRVGVARAQSDGHAGHACAGKRDMFVPSIQRNAF